LKENRSELVADVDKFLKDICRTVGHEWEYYICSRCSCRRPIQVYMDGVLQMPGTDYVEFDRGHVITITGKNDATSIATVTMQYASVDGEPGSTTRSMMYVHPSCSYSLDCPI